MANLGRSERSICPPDLDGSHHLEITGNQLERREHFYVFSVVPHESTAVLQNRVGLRASSPFAGEQRNHAWAAIFLLAARTRMGPIATCSETMPDGKSWALGKILLGAGTLVCIVSAGLLTIALRRPPPS